MDLPDLHQYLENYKKKGIPYPLQVVPASPSGLLKELPAPPAGKEGWPWNEETPPQSYGRDLSWQKVTIVTPSYNQGEYLEETIRSVLLQNYPNLEYIIIDGGSSDDSMEILDKYSNWISHWQSEKDHGQAHAINLGFSLASGQYNAWINSDDYYLRGVFQVVMRAFIRYETDFVYGYVLNLKPGQAEPEVVRVPPLLDYFLKIPTLAQPACFWRASIHQPLWEEMHCALDYELWLRLVKGRKRKRIRQALAAANVHQDAKTHDPYMQIKWQEDHVKMWSNEGHGPVPEWDRLVFFHRVRMKLYALLGLI